MAKSAQIRVFDVEDPASQTKTTFSGKRLSCKIICGDSRDIIPRLEDKVDLIVTSPPYADARKRHYDSIPPGEFSSWFLSFHEALYGVLKDDGNFVLNIKDRVVSGVRHRFVWQTILALEEKGWKSIDDYIWQKTNPMPGRWPTRLRDGWEYCFHLAKTEKPFMNQDAVKIPIGEWAQVRLTNLNGKSAARHNSENLSGFGRDLRKWVGKKDVLPSNVISLPLVGVNEGHPAVFPIGLPLFFIKLFSKEKEVVLDPFGGSGTTAIAALSERRNCILVDNNKKYCEIALNRIEENFARKGVQILTEGF